MSSTRDTFHLFPQLPTELRLAIWRECLPYRVVAIDHLFNDWKAEGPAPCKRIAATTRIDSQPPVITRVCRESRTVAFETAKRLPVPKDFDDEASWYWQMLVRPRPWLDRARAVIHLNWGPLWKIDAESDGDPLRYLLGLATKTKVDRISFCADLLLHTRDFPVGDHNIKWD
jgi:hypothetical protein